jgi:uncharacterized membrane protein
MSLKPRRFGRAEIIQALRAGWLQKRATLAPSLAYAFLFTALGALIIGLLLALGFTPYTVAAFAMPLLCARRAGLVDAAVASVRAVFGNFPVALLWAALLACLTIVSILALPTLLVTLPGLAFSTRALYRQVFP